MRSHRNELRARLLSIMNEEDEHREEDLREELLAVIAAGRENPEEAGTIADVFLDRLDAQKARDLKATFIPPPSARPGLYFLIAMFLTTMVLAGAVYFVVGPLGMASAILLVILFVGGMSWLTNWSVEQRYAREEETWLTHARPPVVVRTYSKDSMFTRDASRMSVLGYELTMQQRTSGGTKVTFELRDPHSR